ncbi:uncharacterized protein Z520_03556 [Fonsecaea multimorphosa CBS 102226]|uniref:Uncharacterized protein n=1 Tax=Fonsecaea multimorphosa CBS 102226 TaxID=1442371 RepID=A0A0D2KCL1_9EURO|nr:uncharacterized protein Z520_03556 [Fonsecaea multimorphosa CBS 102226]KIY00890.1 hypothetical protein Z520_03556 [Fonsecaea multimorphosa CBS 102226]OAL27716.1 hypothetical protein AYO22_03382 [Fonsecaea multimorphosa]
MEDDKRYKDLQRDKTRYESAGWILGNVPIDEGHERWLAKQATASRQGASSDANQTDSTYDRPTSRQTGPPRGDRAFSDSQSSWTSENSMSAVSTYNGYNGEPPAANEWPISLCFHNEEQFEGKVLLDSGAEHNWISMDVVKERHIPWDDDPSGAEIYVDFSNQQLRSLGVVKATWVINNRSVPVKFKIAPNPPFQVCFGYRFLLEKGVLRFSHHGPVAGLVKGKRKANNGEKAAIQREENTTDSLNQKIKDFLDWKKSMEQQGWKWDQTRKKFFRMKDRNVEWNETGYLLDLRVGDPAQNSP